MQTISRIELPLANRIRSNRLCRLRYLQTKPPKRVCFDFDGVVTTESFQDDSIRKMLWPWTLAAVNEQFTAGHPALQDLAACVRTPGAWTEHIEAICRMLRDKHQTVVTPDNLRGSLLESIRQFDRQFDRLFPRGVRPQDGVPELIEKWSSGGATVGIVTSGLRPYSGLMIPRLGLTKVFSHHHIVCVETVEEERMRRPGIRLKPHPDPWLLCFERMKTGMNDHIVLFEDNAVNGLVAANEILWDGYTDVTLVIITRDGLSKEQTCALLDQTCLNELEARTGHSRQRKLTRWGFCSELFERTIIVDSFRELLAAE